MERGWQLEEEEGDGLGHDFRFGHVQMYTDGERDELCGKALRSPTWMVTPLMRWRPEGGGAGRRVIS